MHQFLPEKIYFSDFRNQAWVGVALEDDEGVLGNLFAHHLRAKMWEKICGQDRFDNFVRFKDMDLAMLA